MRLGFPGLDGSSSSVHVSGGYLSLAVWRNIASIAHWCCRKSCTGCAGGGSCNPRAPLPCCHSHHLVFLSRRVHVVAVGPSTASPPWSALVYCGYVLCPGARDGIKSERQPLSVWCLCRGREGAWCFRRLAREVFW